MTTQKPKATVGEQSFDNWQAALAHALALKNTGKITQREYNDVATAAKEAGHKAAS